MERPESMPFECVCASRSSIGVREECGVEGQLAQWTLPPAACCQVFDLGQAHQNSFLPPSSHACLSTL